MDFDQSFDALMGNEGGYSNDPLDPGKETMWGVTAAVARISGYFGPMRDLPRDTAKQIARARYWDAIRADELPAPIRFDAFDTAYNSGVREAVMLLQHMVGAPADGVLGPVTMGALAAFDAEAARRLFNAKRLRFIAALPEFAHDGAGWVNRVAGNLERA